MRRAEFQVNDVATLEAFLNECDYGILSLISHDKPYGVAVNFAYCEGVFYFHGAMEGRKAEAIQASAPCSFTVVKPYAFIPSYFSNTRSASPATQFFASLIASGRVTRLDDAHQKAHGLSLLMEKMQPEGQYEAIDPSNPLYTKMLEKTAVYAIHVQELSFKVKAGQNLSKERYEILVQHMLERNGSSDGETLALMQHVHPKTDE